MSDLTEARPEELLRVAAPVAAVSHRERWLRILAPARVLDGFHLSIPFRSS